MKISRIIERARRTGRIRDNLVLCENCDTPADRELSQELGWTCCAPCVWGEADSFNDNNLILVQEARDAR